MAVLLLLVFIAVPIAEIALFIEVGGRIGLLNTLVCVAATAIVGTWLLRAQGLSVLRRAQENLARQVFPADELFDGLCLLVAGALLLTPGFLTDSLGFLLFFPPLRAALRAAIWRHLSASGTIWVNGGAGFDSAPRNGGGAIIDGEFREMPPESEPDEERKP